MPGRSTAQAFANVVNRVKGIQGSGSGHFTNLENRVYTRHWLPEQQKAAFPYSCVLVMPEPNAPIHDEGNLIGDRFRVAVIVYLPETQTAEVTQSAVEAALKFKDDVFDVLLGDEYLSGQAESVLIASWTVEAGEPPEREYARCLVIAEVHQKLGPEVYGP